MSFLEIKNIQFINKLDLKNKLALAVVKIERVPPHILMICDDEEFHLTVDGPVHYVGLTAREKVIKLKQTQCLFFEIELNDEVDSIKKTLFEIISNYKEVNGWEVSCLEPIKDFFKQQYNIDVSDVSFVFDLIPKLEANGLVKKIFHKNLENEIENGSFKFNKYTQQDIIDCVKAIKPKHA